MAEAAHPRNGPLTHIRVLDLGRIMAAPWATQILADLGADVIKIERPGAGDDTRAWGRRFLRTGTATPPERVAISFRSIAASDPSPSTSRPSRASN